MDAKSVRNMYSYIAVTIKHTAEQHHVGSFIYITYFLPHCYSIPYLSRTFSASSNVACQNVYHVPFWVLYYNRWGPKTCYKLIPLQSQFLALSCNKMLHNAPSVRLSLSNNSRTAEQFLMKFGTEEFHGHLLVRYSFG